MKGSIEEAFRTSTATLVFDDGNEARPETLWNDGCRVAAWLAAQGIRRGDRVAVRMPNGADYVRLMGTCAAGGFVLVSVNTPLHRR